MTKRIDGLTWIDDLDAIFAKKLDKTGGTISGSLIITGDLTMQQFVPYAPLIGSSTKTLKSLAAMLDGQLMIGVTGGAPVIASILAGNNMIITASPGIISFK